MRALWLLLLFVPLSGCTCQPLLEVRNCLPDQCAPSDDAIELTWTAQLGAQWPDVDRLLRTTAEASHDHMPWNRSTERAFWEAFGMPADADEPELIIFFEDQRFRVRVLTCD